MMMDTRVSLKNLGKGCNMPVVRENDESVVEEYRGYKMQSVLRTTEIFGDKWYCGYIYEIKHKKVIQNGIKNDPKTDAKNDQTNLILWNRNYRIIYSTSKEATQ